MPPPNEPLLREPPLLWRLNEPLLCELPLLWRLNEPLLLLLWRLEEELRLGENVPEGRFCTDEPPLLCLRSKFPRAVERVLLSRDVLLRS
jgi:hypothetical protein